RDGSHGDRLGERGREAARQDDRNRVRVPVGRDRDPEDDAEDVDEAVLAPEDEVGEEAGLRVLLREGILLDLSPEREARRHGPATLRVSRILPLRRAPNHPSSLSRPSGTKVFLSTSPWSLPMAG